MRHGIRTILFGQNDKLSFDLPLTTSLVQRLALGSNVPTFTRATTATVMGYAEADTSAAAQSLLTIPAGIPRFEGARFIASTNTWSGYFADGVAIPEVTLKGYLAEGSRTNLCLQSETFDNAYWIKAGNATVTPNSVIAPNGTLTADTYNNNNTGVSEKITSTGISTIANTVYTQSIYLKRANNDWIYFGREGSNAIRVWINLATGVLGTLSTTGTGVLTDATIKALPDGWFRVTLSGSSSDTVTITNLIAVYGDASALRTNNATVHIWGAQFETEGFASSYIPTTTASVTRNADVLTYDATGIYSNSAVSAYAEAIYSHTVVGYGTILDIGDASANNRIDMGGLVVANTAYSLAILKSGVPYANSGSAGPLFVNTVNKFAYSVSLISAKGFVNGSQRGAIGSNIIMPPVTTITIGKDYALGERNWYGNIKNIKIWKNALKDSKLIRLTQ